MQQTTDTLLLVRPHTFRRNEQTAVNNYFQTDEKSTGTTNMLALSEFDNFVQILKSHGMHTIVLQDNGEFDTPDSIFPNNVISFGQNSAILYPMYAANRRRERSLPFLSELELAGFRFEKLKDYTNLEDQGQFLEGTGVLILDHVHKIAYCSISERAKLNAVQVFTEDNAYLPIIFHATQTVDGQRLPIYHTNVMMSVGKGFSVICLDSILDNKERALVLESLRKTDKTIIEISEDQMAHFAGNILEVKSTSGQAYIIMSTQAFNSFNEEQISALEKHGKIIHTPLYTIEKYGGGSARCMLAEVFR